MTDTQTKPLSAEALSDALILELARENAELKASVAVLVEAAQNLSRYITWFSGKGVSLDSLCQARNVANNTLANLPASARAHMEMVDGLRDRLAAAEANQRTPGTVEVCEEITKHGTCWKDSDEWQHCTTTECPLRTKDKL